MPRNTLYTFRGFIFILISIYLIFVPGLNSADLISNMIGLCFCVILSLLTAVVVASSYFYRKQHFEIHPPITENNKLCAKHTANIIVKTQTLRILPLLELSLKIHFEHEIKTMQHKIIGFSKTAHNLVEEIQFPHRGNWIINRLELSVGDIFGLTKISWKQPCQFKISVAPQSSPIDPLPIVSSSSVAGDTQPDNERKAGDYYDFKSYHPSDGARRIIWKIFARSGKLISRHPEPNITPEGRVFIYCLADKDDDSTCNQALQYMQFLQAANLEIFFNCQGSAQSHVLSVEAAQELLIDSCWNCEKSTLSTIKNEVLNLLKSQNQQSDQKLERLLIFCSQKRASQKTSDLVDLAEFIKQQKTEPIFVLEKDFFNLKTIPVQNNKSKLSNIFFENNSKLNQKIDLSSFLTTCSQKNWQVLGV